MATTIQVQEVTVEHLRRIRDSLRFSSYNDAIEHLIRQESRRESFWGAGKKRMTMIQILEGLRDESDRI